MILGAEGFKAISPQSHKMSQRNYKGKDIRSFSGNELGTRYIQGHEYCR
jgi:hypothetical protein